MVVVVGGSAYDRTRSMSHGRPGVRVVANGAIAIVSTVVFLVLGEALLWSLDFPRGGAGAGAMGRMVAEHLGGGLRPWQEEDPDLLWRFKPHQIVDEPLGSGATFHLSTNAAGFRGPELPEVPPEPVVLCVGDSVTAGYGVDDGEAYPRVLEEMLRTRPALARATVVNAGVFGYTSEQGRVVLPRLMERCRPRVVILCYGINDDWPTIYPDPTLLSDRGWVGRIQRWLRPSRIYTLLKKQIVHAKMRRAVAGRRVGPRVPPERYAENLRAMARFVRSRGAVPILVAPPSRRGGHHRTATVELHAPLSLYRDVAAAAAAAENVPYLDHPLLSGRLRQSRWAFVDWCHPGPEALCLLASELVPMVEEALDDVR